MYVGRTRLSTCLYTRILDQSRLFQFIFSYYFTAKEHSIRVTNKYLGLSNQFLFSFSYIYKVVIVKLNIFGHDDGLYRKISCDEREIEKDRNKKGMGEKLI